MRTIIQDAWSVLDHKIKYKKSIPEAMKRKINALAALFEIADNEFFHINEQAKKQEEEARTKQIYSEELKLNVFNFSAIWEKYFSESQIQPVDFKVDNFVHEITEINDTLTANKLSELISEHLETIDSFSEYLFAKKVISLPMNPYTKIRHVLYMSDRECYKNILYILQKKKFDDWLDGKRDNNES